MHMRMHNAHAHAQCTHRVEPRGDHLCLGELLVCAIACEHPQLGVGVVPAALKISQRQRPAHVLRVARLELLLLWPAVRKP